MRVRFAKFIEFCVRISLSKDSDILVITTSRNSIYTVKCDNAEMAKRLYHNALEQGYIDVSELEYTN